MLLNFTNLQSNDLDLVVIVSENDPPRDYIVHRTSSFSVNDYVKEQELYWKPLLFEKTTKNYLEIFKNKIDYKNFDFSKLTDLKDEKKSIYEFRKLRIETVSNHLKIDKEKIIHIKHEHAHQCYAIFAQNNITDSLVLTCEGVGDYSNNTVSVYENNSYNQIHSSLNNHLAKLYKYTTLILGMKPDMHEYKVMGLAPYANSYETEKAYSQIKDIFQVDGYDIKFKNKPGDLYFSIIDKFKSCRFDGIAGGLQQLLEEILCEWIESCIKKSGKNNILFSGGVAQNIKAAKSISEIEQVKNIYIAPVPGDGSLSIGGCYKSYFDFLHKNNDIEDVHKKIKPIDNVYLGPSYTDSEIKTSLKAIDTDKIKIIENYSNEKLVNYLIDDAVIARFSGRMEFGQRALGNRSIISSPINYSVVKKINSKIKFRDFWMPFTPTILKEYENDYLVNPKKLSSPFMTMAFETTSKFREIAPASIHPADETCRPQILEKKHNEKYYNLIQGFGDRTKVYCLLNTSLNLHGMPMVCDPDDAIFTFLNSGLDILAFDNFLLIKKSFEK